MGPKASMEKFRVYSLPPIKYLQGVYKRTSVPGHSTSRFSPQGWEQQNHKLRANPAEAVFSLTGSIQVVC